MPVTRYALAFALRSACPHDLGETLGEHQFPRSANRSEFGEEFGEGSLEPLTRAAERGSAELTVEASRRSPSAFSGSPQGAGSLTHWLLLTPNFFPCFLLLML
jgi:hypothetical protein